MLTRKTRKQANAEASSGTPHCGWNAYLRDAQGAFNGELRRRYALYLQSDDWRQRRAAFIRTAGGVCAVCGTDQRLQVHHQHYRTVGEERLADLRLVCRSCHETAHAGGTADRLPMTRAQTLAWRAQRDANAPIGVESRRIKRRPKAEPQP